MSPAIQPDPEGARRRPDPPKIRNRKSAAQKPANSLGQHFTLKYPDLDANNAVGGPGKGRAVIYVGPKSVKGHPAFAIPLAPGHFSATQPPCRANPYARGPNRQGRADGALHCAADSHAPHKL